MNLQSSITELKGIGEKTSLPFAKVGIHTVLDLLEYYPRDYEIYEEPVELTEIESGKKYAVHGFVESVSSPAHWLENAPAAQHPTQTPDHILFACLPADIPAHKPVLHQ